MALKMEFRMESRLGGKGARGQEKRDSNHQGFAGYLNMEDGRLTPVSSRSDAPTDREG